MILHVLIAGVAGWLQRHQQQVIAYLLPPRSPHWNAHCERFVRSIKEEALDHMLILSERSLHYVVQQYVDHYHTGRNHQGLHNQRITPEAGLGSHSGQVKRRERFGGILHYYYRDAA